MDEYDTAAEEQKERGESKPWLEMISDAQKAFNTYQEKCESIEKVYGKLEELSKAAMDREFQIFWANLEVLRPTIYQRPPRPVVMPRHNDTGEVVRKASELIERVLEVDVELDDLHDTLVLVRDDLAISARGVPWVLDNGHCIHVERCDFVHEPARKWQEVGWVARRAYLTKEQGVERFGDEFRRAKCKEMGSDREDDYQETDKKAEVWEIWSRTENKVVWVTDGIDEVLDDLPPLFDVKGFFPCPKPAYGTLERGTLKPIPDYVYYRDQVEEINELTARIGSLSESLRLKGFYASGTSEVGEAIETAMKQTDNKSIMIPVSNFASLGGQKLSESIVWMPIREVAEVIASCIELRRQLIEDVYEITGLSDIMRGATEANETATAQNLKAQYGSIRVRERQNEMVRVALGVLRIKAEIYAEKYEVQELMQMAGMQIPSMEQVQQVMMQAQQQGQQPDPKLVAAKQVDALLKSQKLRPFAMEVETDSTIAPDEQAEKESRIEFISAIGQFINQAGQMVAAQPETAPFAAELMKFTAGGFRAGRDLGGAIDEFAEQIKAKAAQAGQQPSPEQTQAQAEAEAKKAEIQIKQGDQQIKVKELQMRGQELQANMAMQAKKDQADLAIKQMDLALKGRELGLKVDEQTLKERQAELDAVLRVEELDLEREQQRAVKLGNDE